MDDLEKHPRMRLGLALSGGGSRAIAFHLGCLRALHDLGLLRCAEAMSTVSGGSVIGAAYAYGGYHDFEAFDRAMVELLEKGLQRRILLAAIWSHLTLPIVGTILVHLIARIVFAVARGALQVFGWLANVGAQGLRARLDALQARLPVYGTLSTAFEIALDRALFSGCRLKDVSHPGLEIVINACDLRTGTAFRFGSRRSGGWRYGSIRDSSTLPVAKAVSASAAYPLMMPPLIERFDFVRQNGEAHTEEVVLTDGGIVDNLGLNVLEPGRNAAISVNVFPLTHIICLNADAGQFPLGGRYFWLTQRLLRSFNTVHRRVHDTTYNRIHRMVEAGELDGFVMAYLGQDDRKLPSPPPDLVPREAVRNYPTDFAPMSQRNIELLSRRGEQITRLLASRHLLSVDTST